MQKMCPKLILEGTRLTHKTELAFALNEHPRITGPRKYRYHSPLVSGEWCAFTPTPWGRGIINYEPNEASQALETYQTWVRLFELQKYYSWIVDRFHISTKAYQYLNYGNQVDFSWLEERLDAVGFSIIFCHRSEESFAAARESRLLVSGNPGQYDDLAPFIREQALMKELISQSKLPVLAVDISDNDIPAAANRIADWLYDTGKIWPDY